MNIPSPTKERSPLSESEFKKAHKAPVHVILENMRSAQNVGSIFRTMDAFRCATLHLCGITALPPHREIQKTALGATATVHWQSHSSALEALKILKKEDAEVYAVEQTSYSTALHSFTPQKNKTLVLVMGNEVDGVSQECLAGCDGSIEIAQYGSKHSLNVAVCAGIVLWHVTKGFEY